MSSNLRLNVKLFFRDRLDSVRKQFPGINPFIVDQLEKRAYRFNIRMCRNPQTFNEKIRYKACFDRRPILQTFADKVTVRQHVINTIGEEYLIKAYYAGSNPDEIDWDSLPRQFAMKAGHGSGCNLLVWDESPHKGPITDAPDEFPWRTHRVTKDFFDKDWALERCKFWMTKNYSWTERAQRLPEWAYKGIKPGVVIEEMLIDEKGEIPLDFKLYVFNGKAHYIHVIERGRLDAATGKFVNTSAVMNPDWERVPLTLNRHEASVETPPRPKNLELMVELAEKLSGGIDFVRVDLYNIDGRIYFGELTNYPNAANNVFNPKSYDAEWGKLLVLDKYK